MIKSLAISAFLPAPEIRARPIYAGHIVLHRFFRFTVIISANASIGDRR
jgi:hypothetical protein